MRSSRALSALILVCCSPFVACGDDDDPAAEHEHDASSGSGAQPAGGRSAAGRAGGGSGGSGPRAGAGGSNPGAGGDDSEAGDAGTNPGGGDLREVPCTDQSVSELTLLDVPTDGEVRDESSEGGVFESYIDATGGGTAPTESYTYVRFTDEGLKRVDISDEEAFTSLGWDLAVRRYVMRLNSGVSGPGTVTVARTAPMTTFEAVESIPDGLEYRTEEYFSEGTCELVADTSGIGAPATA
ncbi:MAG: HmuY family protein, partial [Polyangiales bacterium]